MEDDRADDSLVPSESILSSQSGVSVQVRTNKEVLEDFVFGKVLGEGRYGKVRQASSIKNNEIYAVKILKKELISNPQDVARIQRETEILTELNHPNIIKLYNVIETPRFICIVMEYATGGDLYHYVTRQPGGRLQLLEAVRLFRQMTCGIRYCHQHYVVHRDLKLENIFLDSKMNVKIGDFGFSRSFSPGDALSTACGSLHYAAPEIISGKHYIGCEADVWSLGVILYSIICGQLPFDAPSDLELAQKILRGEISSLDLLPTMELRQLLQNMLMVNAKQRATLPVIQRHPALWCDRPLTASLLRPFATILGNCVQPFLLPPPPENKDNSKKKKPKPVRSRSQSAGDRSMAGNVDRMGNTSSSSSSTSSTSSSSASSSTSTSTTKKKLTRTSSSHATSGSSSKNKLKMRENTLQGPIGPIANDLQIKNLNKSHKEAEESDSDIQGEDDANSLKKAHQKHRHKSKHKHRKHRDKKETPPGVPLTARPARTDEPINLQRKEKKKDKKERRHKHDKKKGSQTEDNEKDKEKEVITLNEDDIQRNTQTETKGIY